MEITDSEMNAAVILEGVQVEMASILSEVPVVVVRGESQLRSRHCTFKGTVRFERGSGGNADSSTFSAHGSNGCETSGEACCPTFRSCVFSECRGFGLLSSHDVGLCIGAGAEPTITDCKISSNGFEQCTVKDGEGNGIVVSESSAGTFTNTFSNVTIKDAARPVFNECQIVNSKVAGVSVQGQDRARFTKCTIDWNASGVDVNPGVSRPEMVSCMVDGVFVDDGDGTPDGPECLKSGQDVAQAVANVENGGTLLLGSGTHEINDTITLAYDICIRGRGSGRTIVKSVAGKPAFRVDGEAALENLTLEVMDDNSTHALLVCTASRFRAAKCDFRSSMNFDTKSYGRIEQCSLVSRNKSACEVSGEGTDVELVDCTISGPKGAGLVVSSSAVVTLSRCTVRDCVSGGFVFKDRAEGKLSQCDIRTCKFGGLNVSTGAHALLEECKVRENLDSGNKLAGIEVKATTAGVLVEDCSIHDGKACGAYVLANADAKFVRCDMFENAGANFEIGCLGRPFAEDCKIHNGKASGIFAYNKAEGHFVRCQISDNSLAGIEVKSEANPLIEDCVFRDGRSSGVDASSGEDERAITQELAAAPAVSPAPAAGSTPAPGADDEDVSMEDSLDSLDEASLAGKAASADRVAKLERRQSLRALREEQQQQGGRGTDEEAARNGRLECLLQQAELFISSSRKSVGGAGAAPAFAAAEGAAAGKRARKNEKEEDEEIIREAILRPDAPTRFASSPPFINGTMKPYQVDALNWLIRRHDSGINGILADEMGLGKTLEAISMLAYLAKVREIPRPYLVVAPKSTLHNWEKEINRWAPFFKVVRFHGVKDDREKIRDERIVPGDFDVVVTSYEVAIIEKAALRKYRWRYIVVDEAHRIKNENSLLSRVIRLFNSDHRLLLTGTPLQNNLHELWALLNFLLPEVFASSEDFDAWFKLDPENQKDTVAKLHKVLRPFLLRRLKSEVAKALPPKKEIKLFVGLSAMQKEWYKKALMRDVEVIYATPGSAAVKKRVRLLNVVMQLRKVCNHPYLFEGAEQGHADGETGDDIITNSGKMVVLDKLLPKLQAQGSRVLIFSQMTRMLDILEDYLTYRNYKYARIDGSTDGNERDAQIEEFNKPGSDTLVFLLSTRAGGLGINLATADTVVLYDSDWNPQVDLQAQDRVHRIGQLRPVNVYRFVAEGTVEMKIVQRAERKLHLDAMVIQQGRLIEQSKGMSPDELLAMVRFGADEIFRSSEGTIDDADIDAILARGEEKTNALSEKLQVQAHSLLTFHGDEAELDCFSWDGVNWREAKASEVKLPSIAKVFELPKRDRPANMSESVQARTAHPVKRQAGPKLKQPAVFDFQFYPQRLHELLEKERILFARKAAKKPDEPSTPTPGEDAASQEDEGLTAEEEAEKQALLEGSGFGSWTKKEYQAFTRATEHYGRAAYDKIAQEVGTKTPDEVETYAKVFWERFKEVHDGEKVSRVVGREEERAQRAVKATNSMKAKVAKYKAPLMQMHVPLATRTIYTEEEDAFLVCMAAREGFGRWDLIREEIKHAPQFRFDWMFRSRSAVDIGKRCETLLKLIEREAEDEALPESERKGRRKRTAGGAGSAGSAAKDKEESQQPAAKKQKRDNDATSKIEVVLPSGAGDDASDPIVCQD
eukprot:m51a1_g6676 putative myb domain-containing protein (1645) ;mRNA; f:210997-220030